METEITQARFTMTDARDKDDIDRVLREGLRAVVETQLEMGMPAVRNAFERLQAEGLDQDAALLAITLVYGRQLTKEKYRRKAPRILTRDTRRRFDRVTAAKSLAREDDG